MNRRDLLRQLSLVALGAGLVSEVHAHNEPGRVLPTLAAPSIDLTLHDGRKLRLDQVLAGKTTALQLMFTGCSATCPIQGALFNAVQEKLARLSGFQLLSITIDPLSDDPAAMRRWLKRHNQGEGWIGATPRITQLYDLIDFLKARNAGPDRHTPQVYLFNPLGRLALRTTDFPAAEDVSRQLRALAEASRPVAAAPLFHVRSAA